MKQVDQKEPKNAKLEQKLLQIIKLLNQNQIKVFKKH